MEAHIAGYWIARKLGIPWLANINDPWDWHLFPDPMKKDFHAYYRTFSDFWMRRTLRHASLVTYPSDRLKDYHWRLSGIQHKNEVVPHIGYRCGGQRTLNQFRMVHAGKLGGFEGRSCRGLMDGIGLFLERHHEARAKFRMVLVGPEDAETNLVVNAQGLGEIVKSTGRVNYEDSLKYIDSADVCVLVESKVREGIFLPSKLADYLAAAKPVLALCPRVGVIADMGACTGIARVDVDDANAISETVEEYFAAFERRSLDEMRPGEELVTRFKPDKIAKKFGEMISRLIGDGKKASSLSIMEDASTGHTSEDVLGGDRVTTIASTGSEDVVA
jgi:hypothetical protein